MASDQAILLIIAIVLNYILLYRNNKFFGSIAYIIIGIGSLNMTTGDDAISFGILIIGLALISTIYQLGTRIKKW